MAAQDSTQPIVGRLDHVYYWVADMDRAVSFYRDVLGLSLARRDGSSWAEFELGHVRLGLHGTTAGSPAPSGGATAVFSVDDLDRSRTMLMARGVHFVHEGDVRGYARFGSVLDPDGNTVQLIEYLRPSEAEAPDRYES